MFVSRAGWPVGGGIAVAMDRLVWAGGVRRSACKIYVCIHHERQSIMAAGTISRRAGCWWRRLGITALCRAPRSGSRPVGSFVASGVRIIAERAEQRLSRRFRRLIDRGKSGQKAVTAVARELVGFVWAIAQEDQLLAA